jgi:glycosyltransferase involved in cell wall biosynthesis
MKMRGSILREDNQLILHISNMGVGQGIFVHEQVEALKKSQNFSHEHFSIREVKENKFLTYLLAARRIQKQINIKNPRIVHIHFGLTAIFAMLGNIFVRRKVDYVVSFYGSDLMSSKIQKFLTIISTYLLRAQLIVVSQNLKDELWQLSTRKYIIPNSVDTIFYDESCENSKQVNLIFPSDPNRTEKDFSFFMNIVRELQTEGFIANITIMTNMSRLQIRNCLTSNTIVCLTSKREGSPQIIKEAIVRGVPCICRPVGDVGDYVNDYQVLTAVSVKDFKELIIQLVTAKGSHAPNCDATQFTSNTMLKKLNEVYFDSIN